MWKWIVGAAAVLLLALAGTCWYGYHRLTAGGDSTTIAIAASPERVFSSLADPDSMAVWMGTGVSIASSHHGVVAVGDSLLIDQPGKSASGRGQHYTWTVAEVNPAHLLVLQMRNDSTGRVFAMRRDSLVASGDSTVIISTIASPAMDSIMAVRGDSGGKVRGAILDMGSKVLISAFRIMSEQELKRLKARIEGHPMPSM